MTWRVLVVDDEPQLRSSLERALRRVGYEVLSAAGSDSAYAILSQSKVDVLLLDLRMPQVSGETLFLAVIRRWPALIGRVILMSGDPYAMQVDWPPELQACPFLVKPFGLDELYSVIGKVLPAEGLGLRRHPGQR